MIKRQACMQTGRQGAMGRVIGRQKTERQRGRENKRRETDLRQRLEVEISLTCRVNFLFFDATGVLLVDD